MRRWSPQVIMALTLTLPILAGCLSASDTDRVDVIAVVPLDIASIPVPDGAELIEELDGEYARAILRWTDVELPFEEEIMLVEGATIVRTSTSLAEEVSVRSYMKHSDTGRRRCNPDVADTAWNVGVTTTHTCSGMTAIDRPGENWTVQASGALPVADKVDVIYESGPVDGLAGMLDLSQLSQRDFTLTPTTYGYVDSFDGTRIWTEVTLPEGEGPWPTIIAASPYNGWTGRLGQTDDAEPAMWEYWTRDWAERGYAVVNTDVRGFGLSEGCVEVWSINEQLDQKFTVEWVKDQPWSNGHIGFYGQSYVATTPLAAASHAAEGLDAIVMVAPVVNAYEDWHYGGVPNGENTGSPVAYQALTDAPLGVTPNDLTTLSPVEIAQYSVVGLCDATMLQEANDPRNIYNAFYEERDFKRMVKDISAAVLYTQGFEDSNVKSQMIPEWFNEIESPKLGLFGHWVHQHPTRADEEVLFLGWMDHHVKGNDLGFDALPNVEVVNNLEQTRQTDAWPEADLEVRELPIDFATGAMANDTESSGDIGIVLAPSGQTSAADALLANTARPVQHLLGANHETTEAFAFSGIVTLDLNGQLEAGGNGWIAAALYDVHDDGKDLVTYGRVNLAHNVDHTAYSPVSPQTPATFRIGFLPTEYVVQAGHELVVEVRGVQAAEGFAGAPSQPNVFTVSGATLGLPLVPLEQYVDAAPSAQR